MHTLKCSRWTMFPTAWASRSNCLTFSGAFMALVYSPHSLCEIGVVRRDPLGHRPAQQGELVGRRSRSQGNAFRDVVIEPRFRADITLLVHAFQAKAALLLLPGKERPARKQRGRVAARGDELDPRHEDARRVFLAEEDRPLYHRIHEGRAERPGKTPAFGAHEVDVRLAVDLRATEEEDIDPPLSREVEELARAFAEGVAFPLVKHRHPHPGVLLPMKKNSGCGDGRSCADGD